MILILYIGAEVYGQFWNTRGKNNIAKEKEKKISLNNLLSKRGEWAGGGESDNF